MWGFPWFKINKEVHLTPPGGAASAAIRRPGWTSIKIHFGGYIQMARKVQFVETVLREANQSLIATRLPYEKFEPMLETIDKAGFYAAECWGGATFDVCLRYLNEDPWERLRKIRAKMPNT